MMSPVGQTGLPVRHSGSRYVSGVSGGGGAKGAVSIRDNWQLPPGVTCYRVRRTVSPKIFSG